MCIRDRRATIPTHTKFLHTTAWYIEPSHIPYARNSIKTIHVIKQIAQSNGYKPQMIDKIVEKQKGNKSKTRNISIKMKTTYMPAHYIDNCQKLARTFAKYDYQLAFRTNNDIYNNLKISSPKKKSIYEKSGVYVLSLIHILSSLSYNTIFSTKLT